MRRREVVIALPHEREPPARRATHTCAVVCALLLLVLLPLLVAVLLLECRQAPATRACGFVLLGNARGALSASYPRRRRRHCVRARRRRWALALTAACACPSALKAPACVASDARERASMATKVRKNARFCSRACCVSSERARSVLRCTYLLSVSCIQRRPIEMRVMGRQGGCICRGTRAHASAALGTLCFRQPPLSPTALNAATVQR